MKLSRPAAIVLLVPLALAACGGGAAASPSTPPGTAPAASTPAGASSVPSSDKVNANTASQAELASAFAAAGIPNADRWAREVTEYRPYPADDPTWATLRQELGKYNIDPATLEQIIALLEP